MANIYHGKAKKLEIDTASDFATAVDLGEMKMVRLAFEPQVFEGLANDHPVGGYGIFEANIAEAGSTNETALETTVGIGTDCYVRVTDPADNTYSTLIACPLVLGMDRNFDDPTNPNEYQIRLRAYCDAPSDFVAAPTDS